MATIAKEPPRTRAQAGRRYEYKVIDTEKAVEAKLNELGAQGWRVVGVTTKKQLFIAPPQAIILMREVEPAA
jgi:hypothetical protein